MKVFRLYMDVSVPDHDADKLAAIDLRDYNDYNEANLDGTDLCKVVDALGNCGGIDCSYCVFNLKESTEQYVKAH